MELTILGSSGTWPGPGRATCGYLVSHEGAHLYLDAGSGTFARLQEHIAPRDISAVIVSHGHPDHFVDIIMCFYARRYGGLGEPGLPLYSPGGFVDEVSMLLSEDRVQVMQTEFDFRTMKDGSTADVGPFRIRAFEMVHIGTNALGFRIDVGDVTLAYTGDAGPSENVIELAHGADLFLCEATYQDASTLYPFHMSARQAGEHATAAGVKKLLLTHIVPTLDTAVSIAEAKEVYAGPISVADEGLTFEVGR